MFCSSCEKYLNAYSMLCNFCNKKNTLKLDSKRTLEKTYVQKTVKERHKGAKIKEECPECRSEYLYYYTMQLRSADEGQTVFYECDCGYKQNSIHKQ
ncbi:uncharacterized protein NEPG_00493 [Nematocida parisii ERTm1]|uniref:uncharacterized protein n=1 Tax=Nematocida parisii (strain ERTm1 / ATCC PRA-289) TaxID=881290 RepID=UPI000264B625|nr:uncharacterized protein NEPG_00493 [Nematocida parisii ERTm1]EIJ94968.1 hypothetical protein NEPG_00493 [Nematocida parisii ERTm1]|eukprot:XP_013058324.1 hypothetical protein NEPG_00493 [Nematocida parisii ERTm1]